MKKHWTGNFINDLFLFSYDKAIQLDSKYIDAWNNKGNALYNLKRS